MRLKRSPFVSLCWFLNMMKRSCEVNFSGATVTQSVRENKRETDSAAWYWKLMHGCFMPSPCKFTGLSAWLYYHLKGTLPQPTNINRAITADHQWYFVQGLGNHQLSSSFSNYHLYYASPISGIGSISLVGEIWVEIGSGRRGGEWRRRGVVEKFWSLDNSWKVSSLSNY